VSRQLSNLLGSLLLGASGIIVNAEGDEFMVYSLSMQMRCQYLENSPSSTLLTTSQSFFLAAHLSRRGLLSSPFSIPGPTLLVRLLSGLSNGPGPRPTLTHMFRL